MKEIIVEVLKLLSQVITLFTKSGNAIKKTALVYDNMRAVMNSQTEIGSVLILCTHNSGKNLRTYTPMYVSCLHEDYLPPFHSVKTAYQKLSIDKTYCEMVAKLIDNKDIEIDADQLEDDCLLNSIYEAEKIAKSRIFYLKETKKYFFFITFRTHNENKDLYEPETDLQLRVCVSKIKQLLN